MVTRTDKAASYTHNKPGESIPFGIAGFYTPIEEIRLEFKGREILYVTGKVDMEAPCCNMNPDWVYAMVPGFITEWQFAENDKGEKMTMVEPIHDHDMRAEVREIITKREGLVPVDFW